MRCDSTVGEVFNEQTNPGRKQPFEIRRVMAATVDQDHETLERSAGAGEHLDDRPAASVSYLALRRRSGSIGGSAPSG